MAVLIWYSLASVGALAMYAWDKRRAKRGGWRVREANLHLVALLGGWPGAIVARRLLHHKSRKRGFLAISWAIVALHAAGWGLWLWWRQNAG